MGNGTPAARAAIEEMLQEAWENADE
ncbi:hypothetical protein FJ699_23375 [Serratia marcescens]|nr:hypothetical protein FJ699_23375 [Serratia marcescens]